MQINIKTKPYYIVKNEDTLKSICSKFKIDEQELRTINNISEIETNDILILPKPYKYCYVVQPLDNYQKIAEKLGVSVDKILEVTKGKSMFIGQRIIFYANMSTV